MLTPEETPAADLARRLREFSAGGAGEPPVVPWAAALAPLDRYRLRSDLALLLAEPHHTGEPLDWPEIMDVLREYAGLAGWEGPLLPDAPASLAATRYRVELHADDAETLQTASAAVRRAAGDLLAGFLTQHPKAGQLLPRGRLKKIGNRDIWQVELPDGYRLRYFVDEPNGVVYVVYLGPHPDGEADGRERTVRALVRRRRHGEAV